MSSKSIGFSKSLKISHGMKELERLFSPEFRNRLTETVTFANLSHQVMEKIVQKFIDELALQLNDRNVSIALSPKATTWLAVQGHDEVFGARPLSRLIQKTIRQPLAEEMLYGKLLEGGQVKVDIKKEKIVFKFTS
jgi:ATP-dependent Clp protease ATP-binding subunit ClpA